MAASPSPRPRTPSFRRPASAVCLKGTCRLCPDDCADCSSLAAAIDVFIAEGAQGCTRDDQCKVLESDACTVGSEVRCHGFPVFTNADNARALLEAFVAPEQGCTVNVCDCQASKAVCRLGRCELLDP